LRRGISTTLVSCWLVACGATVPSAPGEPAPPGETPAAPPASTTPGTPPPPTSPPTPPPGAVTAKSCFQNLAGKIAGPDYDQFAPTIAADCSGTHHQNIQGVEKLVFLGDSVTAGTPPTPSSQYYSALVTAEMRSRFGDALEVTSCAQWGATTQDFAQGKNELSACFPQGIEPKKTLVVMTIGGNDISGWRKARPSTQQAIAEADATAARLRSTIDWLKDPTHFPNGSFVTFANVYEYTDTSGDLGSCPAAALGGVTGTWPEGAPAVVHLQEQFMKVAVDTKTDMIFLLEHFCGHGYKRGDSSLQCYRGPNAELWFDLTCIHPTPAGHAEVAKLFDSVIRGGI